MATPILAHLTDLRNEEVRKRLLFVALWGVAPLTLLTLVSDYFYYPDLHIQLFYIRLIDWIAVIVAVVGAKRAPEVWVQGVATLAIALVIGKMHVVLFLINDLASPYYAGIAVVATASVALFPVERSYFLIVLLISYVPYFWLLLSLATSANLPILCVQGMMLISFLAVSLMIRQFEGEFIHKVVQLNLDRQRAEYSRQLADLKLVISRQVAHDIQSPISALTILSSQPKLDAGPTMEMLRTATTNIRQTMKNLLNNFRNTESLSFSAEASNTPIKTIIENTVKEKQLVYNDLRAEVVIGFSRIDEASVFCSPEQFQRLLSNLVNNAVEAIEAGGQVIVQGVVGREFYEVSVTDSGKGIPDSIKDRVFVEPVSEGKLTPDSGLGVGLWAASKWVLSWGGRMRYELPQSGGTRMIVELLLTGSKKV